VVLGPVSNLSPDPSADGSALAEVEGGQLGGGTRCPRRVRGHTVAAETSMVESTATAKAELDWKPESPSYREGIAAAR
jgi:hypothetical protein